MVAVGAEKRLGGGERYPQGGVVVGFSDRLEHPRDGRLHGAEATARPACKQDNPVPHLSTEVLGESLPEDDLGLVARCEIVSVDDVDGGWPPSEWWMADSRSGTTPSPMNEIVASP